METGESCRLLLYHSINDTKRLSAVKSNTAAVQPLGDSVPLIGKRESNTASVAKSSEVIARETANAKGR